MKIISPTILAFFAFLASVAHAAPPSSNLNNHDIINRAGLAALNCGSTNYCPGDQQTPGCVTYGVGYQICDVMYPEKGINRDMCIYCVQKNCEDGACDDLPG